MTQVDLQRLLVDARRVLGRCLFDGENVRDDAAEICMTIDDVLPYSLPEEQEARRASDALAA